MNIYIHVEVFTREIDSKLLLAIIAASRGHQVIVSDLSGIMYGYNKEAFEPGVFHTKSLSPGRKKILRHQNFKDNGFVVTSIDEEGGIVDLEYKKFAKTRYSKQTIKQSSAVFCWGFNDEKVLKKIYPESFSKIHKTGSPRSDLWKPLFSNYWNNPKKKFKKPFLLISSNLVSSNNINSFHERVSFYKEAGYLKRDKNKLKNLFGTISENYLTTFAFIEAIKYLGYNNKNQYDIVLRPHPSENIKAWEIYLQDIPNVHVIREDAINGWVNNSFAVMHNGCTTALEATIAKKPVITYIPFKPHYPREVPNMLGYKAKNPKELLYLVEKILNLNHKPNFKKNSKSLFNNIYIDHKELAAEKIVKVWEGLDSKNKNLSRLNNWKKINWIFKVYNIRKFFVKILNKLFPNNVKNIKKNHKFSPMNEKEILIRVKKLQKLLKIKNEFECKLISERTLLIKK